MSTTPRTLAVLACPECGASLDAPIHAVAVRCPRCREVVGVEEPGASLVLVDAPLTGRSTPRRSADSSAIWAVVALGGVALAAYAVQVGSRPAPRPPEPPPVARPALRAAAPATTRRPPIGAGPIRVVVEFEAPANPPRAPVDPVAGFEANVAFDNPTRRNSRGGPNTFENPLHGPMPRNQATFDTPPPSHAPTDRDANR